VRDPDLNIRRATNLATRATATVYMPLLTADPLLSRAARGVATEVEHVAVPTARVHDAAAHADRNDHQLESRADLH
jgi:hypothetical protein